MTGKAKSAVISLLDRQHGEHAPDEQELMQRMGKIKFTLYGEEVLEKKVTASGRTGRVYLPLDWLGKNVKIVRMD